MTNAQYIKECATVIKLDKYMADKKAKKEGLKKEKEHLDGDHLGEPAEEKADSSSIDELDMELGAEEPPVSEAKEDNELDTMDLSEIDEIEADSEW